MEKNTRNSLFIVLGVAILYTLVKILGSDFFKEIYIFGIVLSFVYFWIPGGVALAYSKREGQPLPIFAKPNRIYWLIPLLTLVTFLIASFATLPFRETVPTFSFFEGKTLWMQIGSGILFFFLNYVLMTFIFSFLFLGSELYWRGYLWDRLKEMGPWKAMTITAILWSVWQIPLTALSLFSNSTVVFRNVIIVIVISFVFTPLLTFFRVMAKSVYAAALCYSSFLAAFTFSIALFHFGSMREMGILGGWFLVVTAFEVLALKLIESKKEKK